MKTTISKFGTLLFLTALWSCSTEFEFGQQQNPCEMVSKASGTRALGGIRCTTSASPLRLYTIHTFEVIPTSTSGFHFLVSKDGGGDVTDFNILGENGNKVTILFRRPGIYRVGATFTNKNGQFDMVANDFELPAEIPWIEGPDSVKPGEVYLFRVNYWNPNYPNQHVKALHIAETTFGDPKYTIEHQSSDGEYRIRFDEPGSYHITAEMEYGPNLNVPDYHVHVFYRPKLTCVNQLNLLGYYSNTIHRSNYSLNGRYPLFAYRTYFTYRLINASYGTFPGNRIGERPWVIPEGWYEEQVAAQAASAQLPNTTTPVPDNRMVDKMTSSFDISKLNPDDVLIGYVKDTLTKKLAEPYWEIWYPRDTCYGFHPYKRYVVNSR